MAAARQSCPLCDAHCNREEEKAAFDQQMADAPARGMRAIYAETQRFANDGVNMLTRLGRGLSMGRGVADRKGFRRAANDLLKSFARAGRQRPFGKPPKDLARFCTVAAFGKSRGGIGGSAFRAAAVFTLR